MPTSPEHSRPFTSDSPGATQAFGRDLAAHLSPASVTVLAGDLGAGKTVLIKGIASYFGIAEDKVTSPTFTLVHEYHGDCLVVHMDLYRLESLREFEMLDLEDYLDRGAVVLMEWGDRVLDRLPPGTQVVRLALTGANSRVIEVASS